MIIDKLKNASLYYGLNDSIKTALKYIENTNFLELENGKYEIEEDNIFVIVQDYETKPENQGKWEAHRKYIDIQFIIKGQEKLGYVNIAHLKPVTDYDVEKDIIFLEGNGNFIEAIENDFLIFAPEDAHMPGISINEPKYVKKAVVKIRV